MNREDLMYRAREIIGATESQAHVDDGELRELVNESYLEVCDLEDWPFLHRRTVLTLVPEQEEYGIGDIGIDPTDRVELVYVGDERRRRLQPLREAERVDQFAGFSTAPSTPLSYTLQHTNDGTSDVRSLVIFPPPVRAEDVTIVSRVVPTELDDDTDQPIFDEQFHPVVAYMAAAYMLEQHAGEWKTGDGELLAEWEFTNKMQRLERRVARFLERMSQFYLTQHDDALVRMGSRRDSRRRRRLWV